MEKINNFYTNSIISATSSCVSRRSRRVFFINSPNFGSTPVSIGWRSGELLPVYGVPKEPRSKFLWNDRKGTGQHFCYRWTQDEDGYIAIGKVGDVLFVVFTERKETIRLISARLTTNAEKELYYDQNINYWEWTKTCERTIKASGVKVPFAGAFIFLLKELNSD